MDQKKLARRENPAINVIGQIRINDQHHGLNGKHPEEHMRHKQLKSHQRQLAIDQDIRQGRCKYL